MGHGSLHAKLSGHINHTSADPNSYLGPDDLCRGATLNAISDHKADSQEINGSTSSDEILVAVGVFDQQTDNDGRDCRGEAKGLGDVTSSGDGVVLHNLEIRVKVRLDGRVKDGYSVSGWHDAGLIRQGGAYRNRRRQWRTPPALFDS